MKRILLLILVLIFILCGCSEEPKPTEPTRVQTEDSAPDRPTAVPTQPTEAPTPLSECSDFELIEATVRSGVCGYRHESSYEVREFTDQEWLLYLMENCEPFRELMFRDSALESLELYAPVMVARSCVGYPHHTQGLIDIMRYLCPDMENDFSRIYDSIVYPERFNENVRSSYGKFLAAGMNDTADAVKEFLHFEDDVLADAFMEHFAPYTETTVLCWDSLKEDGDDILYAVTAFIRSGQEPEGRNVTHFVARFDHQYLVMLNLDQIPADLKDGADLSRYIAWEEYPDYTLIEETLKSRVITDREGIGFFYTDELWLEYMTSYCLPFRELMSRDTALESLKEHAPTLMEKYREENSRHALAFADLVCILDPEIGMTLYTDYELMELTVQSSIVTHRITSSYLYTDQEWLQKVMEECLPFRELMSRDTALTSLRKDALVLIEKYRETKPSNASGFAELVTILIPEMFDIVDGIVHLPLNPPLVEINWIVPEAYNTFLRAAMSGAVPLRYMHFEDEAAEAAFSESFSTYTDATTLLMHRLSDTLYAVDARISTEQDSEGSEVTHFVGCIDDRWLVMLSVDQIPTELKDGVDLSKYE